MKTSFCKDGYTRCQFCLKYIHKDEKSKKGNHPLYSVDHAVPTSRGGVDDFENYLVACTTCNTQKGGLIPEEFDVLKKMAKGDTTSISEMIMLINGLIKERGL